MTILGSLIAYVVTVLPACLLVEKHEDQGSRRSAARYMRAL